MITIKAIRPKRFQNETFKQYAYEMARETADEVKKDYQATTKTWDHKPDFERTYSVDIKAMEIFVGTDDQIYAYVNYGTRPHDIWAGYYTGKSNKKTLAFPSSFTPKTRPNVIGSSRGSKGGETVFTPYVHHPGTKARNFDKVILKKWSPRFKKRALQLLRDFARASGHYAG